MVFNISEILSSVSVIDDFIETFSVYIFLVLVSVSGPVLVSNLDSGSVPFLGLVPICKWVIALSGQGLLKFVSLCGAIAYGF